MVIQTFCQQKPNAANLKLHESHSCKRYAGICSETALYKVHNGPWFTTAHLMVKSLSEFSVRMPALALILANTEHGPEGMSWSGAETRTSKCRSSPHDCTHAIRFCQITVQRFQPTSGIRHLQGHSFSLLHMLPRSRGRLVQRSARRLWVLTQEDVDHCLPALCQHSASTLPALCQHSASMPPKA